MEEIIFTVSDFVSVLNQTLETAYTSAIIVGELANFRISKNRWVYFDLKDDFSSVKFFGTVYQLPGPLEDGLMIQVRGTPKLHQQYGFSINVQFMSPVGEGSIKKASDLLRIQLTKEGLFDLNRKRQIPFPPTRIGLITSDESAAYHDFVKILNERWSGVDVLHANVQVQGEPAVNQIVNAINYFNSHSQPVEVLVITRGGGSIEDLSVFSSEQVTRAVAGSRIPTLVAIGHEIDVSLAELAADQRASTPSNAAQLLVPEKKQILTNLKNYSIKMNDQMDTIIKQILIQNQTSKDALSGYWRQILYNFKTNIDQKEQLLKALSPITVLSRGYSIIRSEGKILTSISQVKKVKKIDLELSDGKTSVFINKDTVK